MIEPSVYKEIFEDDRRGAAVLEDLIQRFARPQVNSGGIDAVLKTYERGGMRLVLDFITAQINRANGVPDESADQGE